MKPWTGTLNGKPVTVKDLAEIVGVDPNCIRARIRQGLTAEEIAETPRWSHRKYRLNGRMCAGWEVQLALSTHITTFLKRAKAYGTTVQYEIDAVWRRQRGRRGCDGRTP